MHSCAFVNIEKWDSFANNCDIWWDGVKYNVEVIVWFLCTLEGHFLS